jgi:hypothetical protein
MTGGTMSHNVVGDSTGYAYGGALYHSGYLATLLNVTLAGNAAHAGTSDYAEGGAIYSDEYLALTNVTIKNSVVDGYGFYGGALEADYGVNAHGLTITGTKVNVTSGGEGGAIYYDDYSIFQNVVVDRTTVTVTAPSPDDGWLYGGAVYAGDYSVVNNVQVTNSSVTGTNMSYLYGSVFYGSYPGTWKHVTIGPSTTTSDSYVEGVFYQDDDWTATDISIVDNDIVLTAADSSDTQVIYGYYDASVTNATISENSITAPADYSGRLVAGVYVYDDPWQMTNVTIARNTYSGGTNSENTGGVLAEYYNAMLKNSIVAANTAPQCVETAGGAIVSGGHNLDSGQTCGFTAVGDLENTAPLLLPVADNGGLVPTMALATGSPAVDAGTIEGAPATDARGVARPQGTAVDIGAYEVQPSAISFGLGARSVEENAGKQILTVSRTHPQSAASVKYSLGAGTATLGSDFSMATGTLYFAPGVASKQIPVTILNDAKAERAESIIVKLTSPSSGAMLGAHPTLTLTIKKSDQRPDGQVSMHRSLGYKGDAVYNRTGLHQTQYVSLQRNQYADFFVRIYNAGTSTDTFTLNGIWGTWRGWIHYYAGGHDITTAMRSAAGRQVTLAAGEYFQLRVRIGVWPNALIGAVIAPTLSATWHGDGTRTDVVKMVVTVVR